MLFIQRNSKYIRGRWISKIEWLVISYSCSINILTSCNLLKIHKCGGSKEKTLLRVVRVLSFIRTAWIIFISISCGVDVRSVIIIILSFQHINDMLFLYYIRSLICTRYISWQVNNHLPLTPSRICGFDRSV